MSHLDSTSDKTIEDVPLIALLLEHGKFVDENIYRLESAVDNPTLLFKYNKVDESKKLLVNEMKDISKIKDEVLEIRQTVGLEMEQFRALCIKAQSMEVTLQKELISIQEQLLPFGYQPPAEQPITSEICLLPTPDRLKRRSICEELVEVTPGLYVSAGRRKPGPHSRSLVNSRISPQETLQVPSHLEGASEEPLHQPKCSKYETVTAPQLPRETSHIKTKHNSERDSDGVLKEPKLSKYFYETLNFSPPQSPGLSS